MIWCAKSHCKKKVVFFWKQTQSITRPKDLWKTIKSLGLPHKSDGWIVGALAENEIVHRDTRQ